MAIPPARIAETTDDGQLYQEPTGTALALTDRLRFHREGAEGTTPQASITFENLMAAIVARLPPPIGLLPFSVTLTPNELCDLNNTPINLGVAAPGVGFKLMPAYVVAQYYDSETTAAQTATLVITWQGDNLGEDCLMQADLHTERGDAALIFGHSATSVMAEGDNLPLVIGCAGGPFKAGPLADVYFEESESADFAEGDTGTFEGGGGATGAAYVIDTVDGGGKVLTLHLTSGGNNNYVQQVMQVTATPGGSQPGVGTGFSAGAIVTDNKLGSLQVDGYYFVVAAKP